MKLIHFELFIFVILAILLIAYVVDHFKNIKGFIQSHNTYDIDYDFSNLTNNPIN